MQALHLLLQFRDLLFEPNLFALARLGRLLPIRAVKLLQITRDALLDLRQAPLHLRVKFRSRLFTALNLLPSIATLASGNRSKRRHSMMNLAHTLRMAPPFSLRKSAIV